MYALLLAIFLSAGPLPIVEQEVECISVAHWVEPGKEDPDYCWICFWDSVQGQTERLDHRWLNIGMSVHYDRPTQTWTLEWFDIAGDCYRVVRTKCWIESWEEEDPRAKEHHQDWFVKREDPGLNRPPKQSK